jgi:hypothetical protein
MQKPERDRFRTILLEPSLEAADQAGRIDIESAGVAEQMHARRRRVDQIGKAPVGIVWREPRRENRRADDEGQEDDPRIPHCVCLIPPRW